MHTSISRCTLTNTLAHLYVILNKYVARKKAAVCLKKPSTDDDSVVRHCIYVCVHKTIHVCTNMNLSIQNIYVYIPTWRVSMV